MRLQTALGFPAPPASGIIAPGRHLIAVSGHEDRQWLGFNELTRFAEQMVFDTELPDEVSGSAVGEQPAGRITPLMTSIQLGSCASQAAVLARWRWL